MYFIDSTKEINTNIDTFINLFFKTDLLGDKQPLPLTFNIDEIEEDIFYNLIEISKDKISNSHYLLEYCIYNENECDYIGIKKLMEVWFLKKEINIKLNKTIIKKMSQTHFILNHFIFIKK